MAKNINISDLSFDGIKNNIKKYINKENIIIHQDKYMDFFYINDLYRVLINIILKTGFNHTKLLMNILMVMLPKKLKNMMSLFQNFED